MTMKEWLQPRGDKMDMINPDFLASKKNDVKGKEGEKNTLGERSKTSGSSYRSHHPRLTPLDTPWVNGQRYREAGAVEIKSRLDCYVEDPAGPWFRMRDILIAVST